MALWKIRVLSRWSTIQATPDADENGNLYKPNIDLIVEMTNMVMARRAFEANLSAIKSTRQMAIKALEIGR